MHETLSTYVFAGQRLSHALLAEIERSGFTSLEIYAASSHFNYRDAMTIRELADALRDHHVQPLSLHSPTSREYAPGRESTAPLSLSDPERIRRQDAVDEVKRALEVAEIMPFQFLVQHLTSGREEFDDRRIDAAFSSLEHLVLFARHRGVTIALENTAGDAGTAATLRHFVEQTRLTGLRFCFDVGHAHLGEGVAAAWEEMGAHTVLAHLNDNHGDMDEHLSPFEGSVDWKVALAALANSPVEGGIPLVLELKEAAAGAAPSKILEAAREAFDKLGQLGETHRSGAASGRT